MKKLAIIISLLILFPATAGCAITNNYGPYYGKVVDAETKEPIEGAAVLVVFYTEEYGPAGAITRFADAVETLTNKSGEFNMSVHKVTVFRPLQGWDKYGYFTIFKPGYGCYPKHKYVRPMLVPNGTLPPDKVVIIELPKLRNKEERLENYGCYPSELVPETKYINLFNLIQQERIALGLEPRKMPK